MTANELACLRSGWNGARLLWPSATDGAVKISQPSSVGSVRNRLAQSAGNLALDFGRMTVLL
jgi:hypothetical protein